MIVRNVFNAKLVNNIADLRERTARTALQSETVRATLQVTDDIGF